MKGFFRGKPMGEFTLLRYLEKNGELHYEYRKRISIQTRHHYKAYRDYKSSGIVPKEIISQGNMVIYRWVKDKIGHDTEEQKQLFEAWDRFDKNPDFPVSVEHEGLLLEGRIISSEDSTLTVRLEKPEQYKGEHFVIYGFGAAMAKKYIYNKDRTFSDDAIATAKNLLIKIYLKQKHYQENKKIIDLAANLNQ